MAQTAAATGMFTKRTYEPGLYPDLSNEDYHAAPGISNSGLALMDKAPMLYYGRRLDPKRPPEKERPGQLEGTLAHCAILEPDEFDNRYVVGPDVRRNTNEWKRFVADHPHQEVIKPEQYQAAMGQAKSVRSIPDVAEALAAGAPEMSGFWRDKRTGVLCKLRPDWAHNAGTGDILLDVKTCGDASPAKFVKQMADKLYHMQAAFYTDGWFNVTGRRALAFVFVAVETEYPYAASAIVLDEQSIEEGRERYRFNLDRYAECRREDHWPGYVDGIAQERLPAYAFKYV